METWKNALTKDTLNMLETLRYESKKLSDLKSKSYFCFYTAMGLVAFYMVYTFLFIKNATEINPFLILADLMGNTSNIVWVSPAIAFYFIHLYYRLEYEKKKDKLDNFRKDVVAHLKNAWYINEYSYLRDEISDYMDGYGVNVRVKNEKLLTAYLKRQRRKEQ